MLKKENIVKIVLTGSICLLLSGCGEESFQIQKESEDLLVTESRSFGEDEIFLPDTEQGLLEETIAEEMQKTEQPLTAETEEEKKMTVHICGAVNSAGVYELKENQRLYEGIALAGGFREDADRDYLNQALVLEDGMKVTVPTKEETQKAAEGAVIQKAWIRQEEETLAEAVQEGWLEGRAEESSADSLQTDGRIDLNTADEALLCTLPGIGESRAKSILAYRQEHGFFQKTEDVMLVSGIKEAAYEKIKDRIMVSQ